MLQYDQVWTDEFFRVIDADGVLHRRESNSIEFKAKFDWADKNFKSVVLKTAAAFANRAGGLILFGIEDAPHRVIGITNFDEVDDAEISGYFNEHLTPSIDFKRHVFSVNGIDIGAFQILESRTKPIICQKDSPKTHDSDIYYRYSGRSSKIKSGDLRQLLQTQKDLEKKLWMDLLAKVAHVGVQNTGLVNLATGHLDSGQNNFILDENILNQIKFLDSYSVQQNGAPAVRIIGDVDCTAQVVERNKHIFEEDIFSAFIENRVNGRAEDYFSSIFSMNSEIYPIYFLFELSGIEEDKRHDFLEEIGSRFKNKSKVVSRLALDKVERKAHHYAINNTEHGIERAKFLQALESGDDIVLNTENDCRFFMESLFSINAHQVDLEEVRRHLGTILNSYYPFSKDNLNFVFRWSLAFIDNLYFK